MGVGVQGACLRRKERKNIPRSIWYRRHIFRKVLTHPSTNQVPARKQAWAPSSSCRFSLSWGIIDDCCSLQIDIHLFVKLSRATLSFAHFSHTTLSTPSFTTMPQNNENELLCEGRRPHQLTPAQRRNQPRLAPHWANQERGRGSFWRPSVGGRHLVSSKPCFWTAHLLNSSNGLHTSRTLDRHSTVFGFVEGGEGFYLQCWAAHIFEDGRNEMFFDANHELVRQDLTPVVCEYLIDLPILEPKFL